MRGRIIAVLSVLGVLVFVGWGCGQKTATPADTNTESEVALEVSDETSTDETPAGWTEYRNERFGFSFQYPEEWDLRVVEGAPFDWNENHYELEEIQLREVGSDDYISVYSFAVVSNPSRLPIRDWLMSHNRTGESLELRDTTINSTLAGVELHGLTTEIMSPDERAFPGILAFSDPEANYVFFPELGQEHEIFRDYGTTPEEFENKVLTTLTFGR